MGMLDGKRIVIIGVASKRSIAWGIAEAMHREGATLAFTYPGAFWVSPPAPSVSAMS